MSAQTRTQGPIRPRRRLAAAGLVAATTVALRLPAPAVATSPTVAIGTSTSTSTSTAMTTGAISATSTATTVATVVTVAPTTTPTVPTVATATGVPSGAIVIDPPTFPATVGDGRHSVMGVALVHNDADGVYRIGEVYVTADMGLAFGLARGAVAGCPDLTIAPGGSCAVALVFVPPAPGPYTARVGVSGILDGRHESADAPLRGLATAPTPSTATISSTTVPTAVPTSTPTSAPTATTRAVPPTEPPHPTPRAAPMPTSTPTNTATATPTTTATTTATAMPTAVATATPTIMATLTAGHGSAPVASVAIWLVAGVGRARWRDAPLLTGPAGHRITVVIAAGVDARVRVDVRAYGTGRGAGYVLTLYHPVEVARADTGGHIRVALPLPIRGGERVRVGALDLDAPTWRCVRTPRLVACALGRTRAGSPATSGQATDERDLL